MKVPPPICRQTAVLSFLVLFFAPVSRQVEGHETGTPHVHFQRPQVGKSNQSTSNVGLQFRSVKGDGRVNPDSETLAPKPHSTTSPVPSQGSAPTQSPPKAQPQRQPHDDIASQQPTSESNRVQRVVRQKPHNDVNYRPSYLDPAPLKHPVASSVRPIGHLSSAPTQAKRKSAYPVRQAIATNAQGDVVFHSQVADHGTLQAGYCDSCYEPGCGVGDPSCGMVEPGCALGDPSCGIVEPGCSIGDPSCGIVEPGCGIGDPSCGLVDPACGCPNGCGDGVSCGSCVGSTGPDYWCFPICLPRFKYLTFWGGVHAFKGPRDSLLFGGPSDGNFGFQEGANIGGRAPFLGLIFPQLSYQLGYQAMQSRLSGTSGPAPGGSTVDRTQHFITGGLFRRTPMGLQGGVVWDMMRDDLLVSQDFHQIRYEASIKSPQGRELGFMGITHANNNVIASINYQPVDQYMLFYRWHFRNAGEGRLWGGATNDSEGLFGGEFFVPLNNRWSLQSGFNYLLTERNAGQVGAREESWNLGMNLVWHFGCSAKTDQCNPHRPLFQTADNGWMFIDQAP